MTIAVAVQGSGGQKKLEYRYEYSGRHRFDSRRNIHRMRHTLLGVAVRPQALTLTGRVAIAVRNDEYRKSKPYMAKLWKFLLAVGLVLLMCCLCALGWDLYYTIIGGMIGYP